MPTVLFACVHNAGRSQMAAAFFNQMADPSKARALSAGTQPARQVHPEVVRGMQEVGIELGSAQPQRLTAELAEQAQALVTMGCEEACPVVPGVLREEWSVADPKGLPLARVREIRDEIRKLVREFLEREGWLRPS
jgi:arsenate reductase